HGEPFHGCAVFHPGPFAAGSEGVGDMSAADAFVAPALHQREGFGLVVFVGGEADSDLGPAELLGGSAWSHVAFPVAAYRVAGVGLHEHCWPVWAVADAVERCD